MATFEEYLNNLGAKQVQIGSPHIVDSTIWEDQRRKWTDSRPSFFGQYPGRAETAGYTGPTGKDINVTSYADQPFDPSYTKFGEVPKYQIGGPSGPGGAPYSSNYKRDAYVDSGGKFLGFGNSFAQLQANASPALQIGYSQQTAQDPAREAQQIANRQALQDLFEQQLAERQQASLAMPTITPSVQQAPVSPMGGWGQPTTQPTTQPTGVLGGGLHRGRYGGMGMLSGGLNSGGI